MDQHLEVALTGTAFTIPAGGDLCTATSLGPKKTCTVTVRYTPASAGANDAAVLSVWSKKPLASDLLNLTGSSPAALSNGCQVINDYYGPGTPPQSGFLNWSLNLGEVVTVTVTEGTVNMSAGPPQNIAPLGSITAPDSQSYTVPADGCYDLEVSPETVPTNWYWSCAAG